MSQLPDIYREMLNLKRGGQRGAVATVVARKGSAPMSGDAKMLVRQDGSTSGTVGGGCLEAEVWQAAMNVMENGEPEKLTFNLTAQEAGDSGHICGGIVDILVEPFDSYGEELLGEIADIRSRGGSAALATVTQAGPLGPLSADKRKLLIRRDGSSRGDIPEFAAEIWRESTQSIRNGQPILLNFPGDEVRSGKRRRQPGEDTEIFIEPITSQPLVYLFGGGHVSFCVAQAAHLAGFRVAVVEDRPAFANAERFPTAEAFHVGEFPEIFDKISVDESDYLAIITRGHANDEVVLEWALKTPARYIGMIGSKSKVLLTYRHLRDKGFDQEELLRRVHAPIGLEIGADTPGEIALAIVAEFVKFRRLGEGAGQNGDPSKRIQLRKKA